LVFQFYEANGIYVLGVCGGRVFGPMDKKMQLENLICMVVGLLSVPKMGGNLTKSIISLAMIWIPDAR